ncbi:MAG: hypothetical protein C0404_08200 [Verrucomicrobia bacterium]|nr:hypothetical protein [Verrucomicrobiota bacterium]
MSAIVCETPIPARPLPCGDGNGKHLVRTWKARGRFPHGTFGEWNIFGWLWNRAAAAKALGQILKDSKPDKEVDEVTAALIEAFKDSYPDVRRESATTCGLIGPAAKACIPHMAPLLNEPPTSQPSMVSVAATAEEIADIRKQAEEAAKAIIGK